MRKPGTRDNGHIWCRVWLDFNVVAERDFGLADVHVRTDGSQGAHTGTYHPRSWQGIDYNFLCSVQDIRYPNTRLFAIEKLYEGRAGERTRRQFVVRVIASSIDLLQLYFWAKCHLISKSRTSVACLIVHHSQKYFKRLIWSRRRAF